MSAYLFNFVKTLTKTEKRIFSEGLKDTKRKIFYVKLVSYYNKAESYNADLDKKIFKQKDKKFIIDCKNTFKTLLYKFLVSQEETKDVRLQVEYKLNVANMLYKRNELEEALKILRKLKMQTSKYEFYNLLIKIPHFEITMVRIEGFKSGKMDLEFLNMLESEQKDYVDKYINITKLNNEFNSIVLKGQLNIGSVKNFARKRSKKSNEKIDLRIRLRSAENNFFKYMYAKNWCKSFDQIKDVLSLKKQLKQKLSKNELLENPPLFYYKYTVRIGHLANKKFDFYDTIRKMEELNFKSLLRKARKVCDIASSYCDHALYINDPTFSIEQMEICNQYLMDKKNNPFPHPYGVSRLFSINYFALSKWEKCIAQIDKLLSDRTDTWYCKLDHIMKLICIYEKGDRHYFNAIFEQHLNKRKKNRRKITNCENISDCLFNILYHIVTNVNLKKFIVKDFILEIQLLKLIILKSAKLFSNCQEKCCTSFTTSSILIPPKFPLVITNKF